MIHQLWQKRFWSLLKIRRRRCRTSFYCRCVRIIIHPVFFYPLPCTPPYLFFLIQSLFSLLSIHRTFFPPYRRDIGALRLRCGSSLVIGVNGLGRMKHCVPLSEIRHLFCVCGISEEIRGCWRWWTNVSSLKKKKPIRNCQRGGNTSHHITSQRRRCFNFTFSNATYLHPLCLKRPLLNFTALLCQFANWSKNTSRC